MPYLNHSVTVERSGDGSLDERGNPTQTWSTYVETKASIQPKTVDELAQLSQAGPVRGDWTIYMYPAGVIEADRIVDGSRVFEVMGVRDAAGVGHHDEIDAQLVTG